MLLKEELITKYQQYSAKELLQMYTSRADYSAEANEALDFVMESKGGLEVLKQNLLEEKSIMDETERIKRETERLWSKESTAEQIKSEISSAILTKEVVDKIVDEKFREIQANQKDTTVDSNTIKRAAIAGAIASITGGTLWGLVMIYSNKIFYIFLFGLAIFCYGIVKLITKKSKANRAVLIASIISITAAILIGALIFQIVGHQE